MRGGGPRARRLNVLWAKNVEPSRRLTAKRRRSGRRGAGGDGTDGARGRARSQGRGGGRGARGERKNWDGPRHRILDRPPKKRRVSRGRFSGKRAHSRVPRSTNCAWSSVTHCTIHGPCSATKNGDGPRHGILDRPPQKKRRVSRGSCQEIALIPGPPASPTAPGAVSHDA